MWSSMDRVADAARLTAIRRRIAMLDGSEWLLGSAGAGMQVDARSRDGELITIFTFTGHASSDEMQTAADALADGRFLLSLLDRAIRAERERRGQGGGGRQARRAPGAPTRRAQIGGAAGRVRLRSVV